MMTDGVHRGVIRKLARVEEQRFPASRATSAACACLMASGRQGRRRPRAEAVSASTTLHPRDPPWSYRDNANAGKRGAVQKYRTLSLLEICALMSAASLRRIASSPCGGCPRCRRRPWRSSRPGALRSRR